jgi:hypothetical protein
VALSAPASVAFATCATYPAMIYAVRSIEPPWRRKRRRSFADRARKFQKDLANFELRDHTRWYAAISLVMGLVFPARILGPAGSSAQPRHENDDDDNDDDDDDNEAASSKAAPHAMAAVGHHSLHVAVESARAAWQLTLETMQRALDLLCALLALLTRLPLRLSDREQLEPSEVSGDRMWAEA